MPLGFSMALDEITLVLFTTLAPTGAMACVIMAAVLVFAPLGEAERTRINRALCIPLIVAMVGLIASATHLGSPATRSTFFLAWGALLCRTRYFVRACSWPPVGCTGFFVLRRSNTYAHRKYGASLLRRRVLYALGP